MKTLLSIVTLLVLALALTGCGKPDIEASCTMNGFGAGKCEFLNNGNGEGYLTITIRVRRYGFERLVGSTELKSGLVKAGDVRSREFLVAEVQEGCEGDYKAGTTWKDLCYFEVMPKEE